MSQSHGFANYLPKTLAGFVEYFKENMIEWSEGVYVVKTKYRHLSDSSVTFSIPIETIVGNKIKNSSGFRSGLFKRLVDRKYMFKIDYNNEYGDTNGRHGCTEEGDGKHYVMISNIEQLMGLM